MSGHATAHSGRDVRYRRFDERIAVYDLNDNAGEQVLGGPGRLADRVDFSVLYQNAAGLAIIPSLAQIAAGFDQPHPLHRLTHELREELATPQPRPLFEAIDRAWTAPVDGVSPASRWVRARSIVCPSVRDGEFVALIPAYWYNNVNPKKIRILQFERTGYLFEDRKPSGRLRFTGAGGVVHTMPVDYDWPVLPDFDEGAYLVEVESAGQLGQTLSARSWILSVDQPFVGELLWDGVAVVFVDQDGKPVNIPRENLSVNGRIMARIPGGVIALPYAPGDLGNLTFRRNGRVIGTVTATGPLPRLVVLPVSTTDPQTVVSWTPYHPRKGGTVSVTFRRDRSSLPPDGPAAVDAILFRPDGTVQDQVTMTNPGQETNVFYAELDVPGDLDDGVLAFTDGTVTHTGCRYTFCGWFRGYEFETRESTAYTDQLSVAFDGVYLIVTFDDEVDSAGLLLRSSPAPDGPWSDLTGLTAVQDGNQVRWKVRGLIGNGVYIQLVATGGSQDQVLLTQFLSPTPAITNLAAYPPFPNPSPGVVRWPFEILAPVDATLDVYDVSGRRVFTSGPVHLHTGVEVFSWDGSYRSRLAASGVYFLRVKSPGQEFTRKVVIVR